MLWFCCHRVLRSLCDWPEFLDHLFPLVSESSTGEFQLLMLPGTESDLHYITLVMHCHLCRKKKIKSHRLIFAASVKKSLLKHHHYWPGIRIQEFKYFLHSWQELRRRQRDCWPVTFPSTGLNLFCYTEHFAFFFLAFIFCVWFITRFSVFVSGYACHFQRQQVIEVLVLAQLSAQEKTLWFLIMALNKWESSG